MTAVDRPVFGQIPDDFYDEPSLSYGEVMKINRRISSERQAAEFSVDIHTMAQILRVKPIEVERMRVNRELIAIEVGEDENRKILFPTWQQELGFVLRGVKE